MKKLRNNEDEELKNVDFSSTMYRIRNEHHLTQKQLADIIGVSDKTVSNWENGVTTPDLVSLRILCRELDISAYSVIFNRVTFKDRFKHFERKMGKVLDFLMKHIFVFIIAVCFILLLAYFINNYNSAQIYRLKYESENISIKRGYLFETNEVVILYIDNISLEKLDYEYKNIVLDLYTYVEGDKISLYKANNLEDIVIEEFNGYETFLTHDVLLGLKQNMYLDITAIDQNKKEHNYSSVITLNNKFSNDKINYDTLKENTYDSSYLSYLGKHFSTFSINSKMSNPYPVFKEDISLESKASNKILDLGFEYDEENNKYIKEDKYGGLIKYFPEYKKLEYKKKNSKEEITATYTTNPNMLSFINYDNFGSLIVWITYFPDTKDIICKSGNCKKYQDTVDYILHIYAEIMSTENY